LQRFEVSEFEVGSFFFFFKSDWFPALIIRFANFELFRVISYYQVFVLWPSVRVVFFFFFFLNFFSHPFGLFIFLNLQSIWFLCFGIVFRFCVSVCVGLSQLL
jgi:hypothetical protein